MATMKEIGLGVTTVLQGSETPEPLFIDLWNQEPADAAELVRSVLTECHDGGIPLKLVRVPIEVWELLSATSAAVIRPPGARIELDEGLGARVEFWRKEPT